MLLIFPLPASLILEDFLISYFRRIDSSFPCTNFELNHLHYQLEKLASSCLFCFSFSLRYFMKGIDLHYPVYQLFCRMKTICLLVIQWQVIRVGRGLIHYFKVILGLFTRPLSVPLGTSFFHPLQTQLVGSDWPFCFLFSLVLFFLEIMNISVILILVQFDCGAQN